MLVGALFQPCVGSYRHEYPHLDLILDSMGLPLMSCFLAVMAWRISKLWSDHVVDGPFNWVSAHDSMLLAFGLFVIAGGNLAIAIFVCNRYAAVWSFCRAMAGSS
ncbi:hypothetical protein XI03_03170 [Bradyrhizobium sp. CCBAU 65884]|nr:hypothetical protein [Bradyrhizobium sp. CCBAU 65884]